MQTVGQLVTQDGTKGGIVTSVGSATVTQPDRITIDRGSGNEISRESQPPLEVQTVHVKWEDGTESDLTEIVDQWSTFGSVAIFPRFEDDPVAGAEGTDEHKAQIAEAVGDVAAYMTKVRAAAPYAEEAAAAAGESYVIDDPTYHVTIDDGIRASSNV